MIIKGVPAKNIKKRLFTYLTDMGDIFDVDEIIDDVLDSTFDKAEDAFIDMPMYESELGILETAFLRLQFKFEKTCQEKFLEQKENWVKATMGLITDDLYDFALDKAFREFFRKEKFKKIVLKAEEKSKDKVVLENEILQSSF